MVQTCTKCSRANPEDAVYCYFDGFVLSGHGRNGGGPVAVGSQTFGNPFVFPTGRACRSFDELAVACQDEWSTARDLLQKGYLENFLGGLGRIDLAQAAQEAARFPDADRGLDQLLTKLPSEALSDPKLRLDPLEINLGVIKSGEDRQLDLVLENQGNRLLYGTISCADPNSAWLGIGDANATEKHVQLTHELTLPVHVRGDRLRASNKPLEARLAVETNGGSVTVVVRAEVPVKSFPAGPLGGAKSPRQVAEKAKANPKEAAPLFEKGAVADWYKDNGWTYPVQGPSASGLGAVQQFFEALGLTPPPKVEISTRSIELQGNAGEQLRYTIEVKTQEKRPVYAHASSNQPWLEVSRAKLNGRVATINVSVPSVPDRGGETLKAQLVVQSNGNQRFVVPVTLAVAGQSLTFDEPQPLVFDEPVETVTKVKSKPNVSLPPLPTPEAPPPVFVSSRRRKQAESSSFMMMLPALLLGVALLGVIIYDLAKRSDKKTEKGGNPFQNSGQDSQHQGTPIGPQRRGTSWENWAYNIEDREPLLSLQFSPETSRFGLVMLKEKDPNEPNKYKRLTFHEDGESNNTRVLIQGDDFLFGFKTGRQKYLQQNRPLPGERNGKRSVMTFPGDVKVTQHVELVPSEQSKRIDTCLIYYTIENTGTTPRKVGLRIMLDTFIGGNDGVPFVIPGKGLVQDMRDLSEKQIPDYIEALEKPDLKNPGTVVHLGLKGIRLPGANLEPPSRVFIGKFQGGNSSYEPNNKEPFNVGPKNLWDSAVWIYWPEQILKKNDKREMAITYGLGAIAVQEKTTSPSPGQQQIAMTTGGSFKPGDEFTVTAYVQNPKQGQKVQIELPPGLTLADGESTEKSLDKGDYSQVSWRVRSSEAGSYTVKTTSEKLKASVPVNIRVKSIFG